jgi:hypothetical protein
MSENNFKVPTEMVELPSKGLVYPQDSVLASGKIEMKYMTAKEEDILTNQNYLKQGIVLEKLLKSLIVTPGVDYDDLILGDKNAVLVAARILGYGKDYTFKYKNEDVTVDLTECPLRYLPEDTIPGKNSFEFTLPTSGAKLTYKILTNKDEKSIQSELEGLRKINKDASPEFSTRLKFAILSVNGDESKSTIRDFVDNYFLAKDTRAFRDHLNNTQPDIVLRAKVQTSEGIEEDVVIPVNASFFWPDADL